MECTGQNPIPGAASDDGPSLAFDGSTLWMAWKGIPGDHGLYYSTWDLAHAWTIPQRLSNGGSSNGPSIAIVNGVPVAVWKGVDGDDGIYYAAFNSVSGNWEGQRNVGGIGTSDRPYVTMDPLSQSPRMVWKGVNDDQNLYTSDLRGAWTPPTSDGFWQPQQQVGWVIAGNTTAGTVATGRPGSGFGPCLVTAVGKIFMVWRGVNDDQDLWFTQGAPDSPSATGGPAIVEWSQDCLFFSRCCKIDAPIG
jgi:hypothetical protein